MKAFCCECKKRVDGVKVNGDIIYPHRPDLYDLEFIKCPICGNYTGKYDGEYPVIPTKHIRLCRYQAHRALDKIWKNRSQRAKYYQYMSNCFGRDFHWGELKSEEEADKALELTLNYLGGGE